MTANAPRSIAQYLSALRHELSGADPALVQDALYDAEEYLRAEVAGRPELSEADVLELIASTYGAPAEVAAAYRQTEATVAAALAAPARRAPSGAAGRVCAIYGDSRAWTSLFHALLALPTGIFYFVVAVAGLSLSAGLSFLIIGLPFFLLDAQLVSRRTEPLVLAGPPGFRERLEIVMEAMFAGSTKVERRFTLEIRELALHERVALNGLAVTPYLMKHYSGAPSYAVRVETEGKVLTYSGDTEWVDELVPAARNADLFICEAYFFDKVMKYHIDYSTLAKHLPQIGAKRTIVTHMSAELLGRQDEIALEAAHDGLVVEF